jgi:hypothetical protein
VLSWNYCTEEVLGRMTGPLRRRRVRLFVEQLRLGPHHRVLDLGSEDGSYLGTSYPHPENVLLGDIDEGPMKAGVVRYGLRGYRVISPEGPLPFGDQEFDAVWCNSVIEHVTLPRSELERVEDEAFCHRADEHQFAFAREIARVGKRYLVQTPYIHFPVESHSWLPLVQYLSQERRWRLSRRLSAIWVKRWRADFLLYDQDRFRRHFFDATRIVTERVLGIPKSLIAVKF